MQVLVIDDDAPFLKTLRIALSAAGCDVVTSESGQRAIHAIAHAAPDIVFLDLGLPDIDGMEVLRQVRAFSAVPLIILSGRGEEREKIAAFNLGAADYVEKPVKIGELLARMRAALRDLQPCGRVNAGKLILDMRMRWVKKNDRRLKLSRNEYEFLAFLARGAGKARSHEDILRAVCGDPRQGNLEYLRVLVHQLRAKVEDNPANPGIILTEPGFGYRLAATPK